MLTAAEARLLLFLWCYASLKDVQPLVWVSQRTAAKKTGTKDSSINRCMRRLVEVGAVVKRGAQSRSGNLYLELVRWAETTSLSLEGEQAEETTSETLVVYETERPRDATSPRVTAPLALPGSTSRGSDTTSLEGVHHLARVTTREVVEHHSHLANQTSTEPPKESEITRALSSAEPQSAAKDLDRGAWHQVVDLYFELGDFDDPTQKTLVRLLTPHIGHPPDSFAATLDCYGLDTVLDGIRRAHVHMHRGGRLYSQREWMGRKGYSPDAFGELLNRIATAEQGAAI